MMHEGHGSVGDGGVPDGGDCPCRGQPHLQASCAQYGCGFCLASQEQDFLRATQKAATPASQPSGVTLDQLVSEVKVLRLQPGDVVVLKSDQLIGSGDAEPIQRASVSISRFVGFRVSVMVVPSDADVEVLRSGDGTTLLPHEAEAQRALQPVPMGLGTTAINILKSNKPGGLTGIVDALTAEDDSKCE